MRFQMFVHLHEFCFQDDDLHDFIFHLAFTVETFPSKVALCF